MPVYTVVTQQVTQREYEINAPSQYIAQDMALNSRIRKNKVLKMELGFKTKVRRVWNEDEDTLVVDNGPIMDMVGREMQ